MFIKGVVLRREEKKSKHIS